MLLVGDRRLVPWLTPVSLVLFAMTLVGLFGPVLPGLFWYDALCRLFFVFGAFGVGVLFFAGNALRRRVTLGLVIAFVALHVVTPLGVPDPGIDVFLWTQSCLQALGHGIHPYTIHIVYETLAGRTAPVYPYMPFTLIAFFPAYALFGDYRFLSAAAIAAAVILIRASGRRLEAEPAFIDAATLALVLHPRSPWITAMGWTEGLVLAVAAAFVYLAIRWPGGFAQAIAFFLLPASKQYILAPVLLYVGSTPPRQRLRVVAVGAAVAILTLAPFVLWNWRATIDGIVTQMRTPASPRLDATSFVALAAAWTGAFASRWLSVAVHFGVAALAYLWLRHHGLAGVLLGSALTLCATFLAGWQAFVNYYCLVAALLVMAALVFAAPESVTEDEEGARQPHGHRAPRWGATAS